MDGRTLGELAITLESGLIVDIPYSVMDAYHLIPFKADMEHLVILQV